MIKVKYIVSNENFGIHETETTYELHMFFFVGKVKNSVVKHSIEKNDKNVKKILSRKNEISIKKMYISLLYYIIHQYLTKVKSNDKK